MGTGSAESKAVRKVNPRVQTVTVEDGETIATGYFSKEHRDFCAFEVDTAFDGAAMLFLVTNDIDDITSLQATEDELAWEGDQVSIACSATARKQSIDPSKFAMWQYIVPMSDTAQSGADCVVTGYFRDFRA